MLGAGCELSGRGLDSYVGTVTLHDKEGQAWPCLGLVAQAHFVWIRREKFPAEWVPLRLAPAPLLHRTWPASGCV